jgi:hypothetical protein
MHLTKPTRLPFWFLTIALVLALAPAPATVTISGPSAVAVGGRMQLTAHATPPGGTYAWTVDPVLPAAGSPALANPMIRIVPRGRRATVVGLQTCPALAGATVRVTYMVNGNSCEAAWSVTCASGDLTAYRPRFGNGYFPQSRTAVDDADETSTILGPGIRINGASETDPGAEDDLIELEVAVSPAGVDAVLERENGAFRVWTSATRTPGTELAFTRDRTPALPLGPGGTGTVWVEWTGSTHGDADLRLVPQGSKGALDRVTFHTFRSIVMALGGEGQVPSVPVDPNHGTFVVGRALYALGYDVHLFDEDTVSFDGSGAAYDEVVNAIQDRAVSEVVSFGYSHGGGSTYDLAERLDTNRGSIGTFTIPFTSYVDGVGNNSDTDTSQENRRPPSTGWHANHYQVGQFIPDFFLDGGPVPSSNPPATGLNVETTAWGSGATHFIVDDYTEVRDYIHANLLTRVTR